MAKCVIIGGAEINNYDRIKQFVSPCDLIIYCDGGLAHKDALGFEPDIIVGDFDSYENPNLDAETIVLPKEKDDTDTAYALKVGLKRKYTDFLFLGVIGQRLDHTLGNLSFLLKLDSLGLSGRIIDDYSIMQVVSKDTVFVEDSYCYFSLLNISGQSSRVTIKNAKYPLDNAEITCEYQYGISNEVLPSKTAEITVNAGRLLLIKVF